MGPGVLNVSVILSQTAAPGLWAIDTAHRYVLDGMARSICRAGVEVALRGTGDLAIGDRKCGGSAQRRLKRTFLVHCTILLDFAIERIERYLTIPSRQPAYRAGRTHTDFLCNLPLSRAVLIDSIRAEFCRSGRNPYLPPPSPSPPPLVYSLVREKYSNPTWTERF